MPELKKEQLEALMHEQGNILVSASAGSGKTFVMIERLIRLITEGKANVSEILAVTFTEASASDMKEKLKKALIEKINETGDSRLVKELGEVATADISTLHSFCGRLIRSYFFVANVNPDFKIIDETESAVLRLEAVEKTFKEFYDKKEDWFIRLIDRHAQSRSDKKLKELILSAYSSVSAEVDINQVIDAYKNLYTIDGFNTVLFDYKKFLFDELRLLKEEAVEAFSGFKSFELNKSENFCKLLINDIDAVLNSEDIYFVKKFEDYSATLSFERNLSDEAKELKTKAVNVRDKLKKLFKRFNKHLSSYQNDTEELEKLYQHTEWFANVLKRFTAIYSELKGEENALDFADLEHFALKVLSDSDIKQAVREKYKYVFVDEYQDINGVQEEIILSVSNDNVFMVGDVKQSIYGFRGCRPEIFSEKFDYMQKTGEKTVLLNYNFRSAKAVLEMVNKIFSYSMTEKFFGTSYVKTSTLRPGGVYPDDADGRAQMHLLIKDNKRVVEEEQPRIYNILEEIEKQKSEQNNVDASMLTEIINSELLNTYYDPKEKAYKKITYGDIAILTRNKSNKYVSEIVKGLNRHGIPVSSEVKENICDFPEIQAMVNVLKLIDCFAQDIPLASTLKGPIGKLTDEELYEIAIFYRDRFGKNGKGFYYAYEYYLENGNGELQNKLKLFNEYFKSIRLVSDFIGAHGTLVKLIAENGLENYLLAQSRGESKVNRLRRFVENSNPLGKTLTIKEFLFRIENCPDAFTMSECADEDTVKAMTIHASKGLEFPVVIVCGLERKMNFDEDREQVLFDRDLGFAFKFYNDEERTVKETPLRGLILEKIKSEKVREELRLFYVATTRATYSMHLTFTGKEDGRKEHFTGADKFLDYVPLSIPISVHTEDEYDFSDLTKGVRKVIIGKADENLLEKMKRDFEFSYPFLADTTLPLKNTVTAAIKEDRQDFYTPNVIFLDEVSDAERGTTAHKILELYDFNGANLFEQVDSFINKGFISEEQTKKVNLERIEKVLNEQAFMSLKDKKLYREKSFLVEIEADKLLNVNTSERVLLQGVIDLLAVGENGLEILDYKYSKHDGEYLKATYKKQLDLYAYAAQKILKKPVVSKKIVNLLSGEIVLM